MELELYSKINSKGLHKYFSNGKYPNTSETGKYTESQNMNKSDN